MAKKKKDKKTYTEAYVRSIRRDAYSEGYQDGMCDASELMREAADNLTDRSDIRLENDK